ncbi:antirestriction protein ArdA [Candidatus Vondammii sp. HM_W22]|uniref:antirestriction protein ArdA n=1 Tax=Candidatus Vondammii sp. HM_W22 TaxID=2687299 RepID=UPI002E7B0C45|nr:antirestriction protein ArdA [Candidatus Vondammii sp. HM_W22]
MCSEIRIYVACLAAYNSGYLHGAWIDACDELDDIQEQVQSILKSSPIEDAEEYAIHDYEGFDGYGLSEYEGLESVQETASFIDEYPAIGGELLNHFGGSLEDAKKAAEESYSGCYKSLDDYAEELTDNTSEIPENLAYYIDYERMGRDMEMSGDIYTIETAHDEVHIFWSH